MKIKNDNINNYILLPGVILITALGHISTLKNHLVADSWVFVFPRSFLETLGYFVKSIIPPEWEALWLRPVPMFSFWFDTIIWPGTEWGPHLTNIFFHLCNVWLIWLLIQFIYGQSRTTRSGLNCRLPAITACLVYGLHPLNVGSAGWVGARFDVISVTFGLAGMLLWLKWNAGQKNTSNLIFSCILLMCAILSKEQGIVFLLVCFIAGIISGFSTEKERAKYWNCLFILALLVVFYMIYRFMIFSGLGGYLRVQRGINPRIPFYFLSAVLFPYLNIFPDWTFSLTFWLTSIAIIALFVFMWTVPKISYGRVKGIYIFCAFALFAFGLATTAPHAGMSFKDIMGHSESRFTLAAIAALSLIIGIAVMNFIRSLKAYRITLIAVLIWGLVSAWRTDVQIQAWKDAGRITHHIITETVRIAPNPPDGSQMLFLKIPQSNNQFAYIFGIGLKEAILINYPDRNDLTVIGRATNKDLRRANPERDYVFAFNDKIGKLERLFPEKKSKN